jgi:queuine tRNA-ribosyltransferase
MKKTNKNTLLIPNSGQVISLPIFIPDATFGVVRGLDAQDLHACGIQAIMMNTFHLMQSPGASIIQSTGGLGPFSGWKQTIFTDSGGFQAYSLIREGPRFGHLSDKGITFQAKGKGRKFLLTPEKCIQLQFDLRSHVFFCLDDCTHVDNTDEEQRIAVERTIQWAGRCKREYEKILNQKEIDEQNRPLLFAIVQGGKSYPLRELCAEALLEIGFDGYGYGGWPLDKQGKLVEDMLMATRELIPQQYPLHALGIGHPEFIIRCAQMGYELFDSALPTRDARHGRLYRFAPNSSPAQIRKGEWGEFVYIQDERYTRNTCPLSEQCDCSTCQHTSTAYLHHLYMINDVLYQRLATIHNLHYITQLCQYLAQDRG